MKKLRKLNFSTNVSALIEIFLNDCIQRKKINGNFSEKIEFKRKVAKGTVIGPLCSNYMSVIYKID